MSKIKTRVSGIWDLQKEPLSTPPKESVWGGLCRSSTMRLRFVTVDDAADWSCQDKELRGDDRQEHQQDDELDAVRDPVCRYSHTRLKNIKESTESADTSSCTRLNPSHGPTKVIPFSSHLLEMEAGEGSNTSFKGGNTGGVKYVVQGWEYGTGQIRCSGVGIRKGSNMSSRGGNTAGVKYVVQGWEYGRGPIRHPGVGIREGSNTSFRGGNTGGVKYVIQRWEYGWGQICCPGVGIREGSNTSSRGGNTGRVKYVVLGWEYGKGQIHRPRVEVREGSNTWSGGGSTGGVQYVVRGWEYGRGPIRGPGGGSTGGFVVLRW